MRRRKERRPKPQECPHCRTSLVDTSVPPEFADLQDQFTLALSTVDDWICPTCLGTWPR